MPSSAQCSCTTRRFKRFKEVLERLNLFWRFVILSLLTPQALKNADESDAYLLGRRGMFNSSAIELENETTDIVKLEIGCLQYRTRTERMASSRRHRTDRCVSLSPQLCASKADMRDPSSQVDLVSVLLLPLHP